MLHDGSPPSGAAVTSTDRAGQDVECPSLKAKTSPVIYIKSYYFIYNPNTEIRTIYMWQGTLSYSLSLADVSMESWDCRFQ